jgi:SAM-dependent methyltransferase
MPPALQRLLLAQLGVSLLLWARGVFAPAIALKRAGRYQPATLGVPPATSPPSGGGRGLSLRYDGPQLLPEEPGHYDSVREFDHIADEYEGFVRPFSDPIVHETIELMRPFLTSDARILDPSAGPGSAAIGLSRLVPEGEVIAADLSRGMVETAFRNAQAAGRRNMAFFQADVGKPPPDFEGYFDAIFCCLSFHHYPDGEAAARAFRRSLSPRGKAFIADGGPAWFVALARPISMLADPGFVRHRTGEEFRQLFTAAGFSSVFWIEVLPGIGVTVASA